MTLPLGGAQAGQDWDAAPSAAVARFAPRAKRVRRLAAEFLWLVGGQGLSTAAALASVQVLTHRLAPSEYGRFALGMTVFGLMQQTLLGPLGFAAQRFYPEAFEAKQLGDYRAAVMQLLGATAVALVVCGGAAVTALWIAGSASWLSTLAAAAGFAIFSGANSVLNGIENAARKRRRSAAFQAGEQWLRVGLMAVALQWMSASATWALIGSALASLAFLLPRIVFPGPALGPLREASPSRQTDTTTHWRQTLFTYLWPFSATGVFCWAQMSADSWTLQFFRNSDDVGRYFVLFQLGCLPMTLVSLVVTQFLSPVLFRRASLAAHPRGVARTTTKLAAISLVGTAVAFAVAWGVHSEVFQWLTGSQFWILSPLLPWMVLAGGLLATGHLVSLAALSGTQTTNLIPVKVVTAVLGIGFSAVGAKVAGTTGVVAGNVAFSAIYAAWMMRLAWTLQSSEEK